MKLGSSSSTLCATLLTFVLVTFCCIGYLLLAYVVFTKVPPGANRAHVDETINGPTVMTTTGRVEGVRISRLGKHVDAFLGIPYASSPTGELRFSRPEPVPKWKGVYRAHRQPPACMQFTSNAIELPWSIKDLEQSETDCLRLNVWAPVTSKVNASRPVMIWIHGGGFVSGHISSPEFDGSALATYTDTVVAMMNYRVGVFGFLNLNHPDIEGNMGMYDQVLALQWIKENAAVFGGDPDRITLFGESAGGASVGYHLISPMSRGLFNRAIMQSGTPLMPTALITLDQIHAIGNEVVARAGCNFTEIKDDIVNCIKSQPTSVLLDAQAAIIRRKDDTTFSPSFFDDFLPEHPIDALRDGDIGTQRDIMIGYNRDEGSVFMFFANATKYAALGEDARPTTNITLVDVQQFATRFMRSQNEATTKNLLGTLYSDVNETIPDSVFNATRINVGEFFVACPSMFMAEELSNNNRSVYFYHFNHRPSNTPWASWVGAAHYEEVQFVFGIPLMKPHEFTKDELLLSKQMMRSWATFAATGKPDQRPGMMWPTYHEREPWYVDITAKERAVKSGLPQKRCNFWRLVYEVTHSQLERPTPTPLFEEDDEFSDTR